jgi:hypothetical protein
MASIICRNGTEHRHASVEDVRACYAGRKAQRTATFRENIYPGACALCGQTVAAKGGRILPKDGGQKGYDVLHLAGECPKGYNPPNAREHADRPERRQGREDFSAVPGGFYATVSRTGNNDYDFWKVTEGRKPGYRFVKRYIGGQGATRISTGESVAALKAILAEGVDVCGDRFADELGQCRDCGLPLTDEISRRERRGPVCRNK